MVLVAVISAGIALAALVLGLQRRSRRTPMDDAERAARLAVALRRARATQRSVGVHVTPAARHRSRAR